MRGRRSRVVVSGEQTTHHPGGEERRQEQLRGGNVSGQVMLDRMRGPLRGARGRGLREQNLLAHEHVWPLTADYPITDVIEESDISDDAG